MLSVTIITRNEAHDIQACLESVRWADEIVVLDSGSSDGTQAICRRYTDNVIETDWPGFGPQKNRALDYATGDWILSLDADERVPADLANEIQAAMQEDDADGYEIPRLSYYCGRPMHHGGWWPDYTVRLFRRGKARFSPSPVHEKVEMLGPVGRLNRHLVHYSFRDVEEVLEKMDRYSTISAQMLYELGVQSSLTKAVVKGVWSFVQTYILRAGFLDGRNGFLLAVSNAEGTFYKYVKLLSLQHSHLPLETSQPTRSQTTETST